MFACGDDTSAASSEDDAGDASTSAGCAGLPPVGFGAMPPRVRVGSSLTLAAIGGSGHYAFAIVQNGSSGSLSGDTFVAGQTPGEERFVVKDTACGGEAAAVTLVVVGPFRASPRTAVIRPSTSFDIRVEGAIGNAVFELQSTAAGSTLDSGGKYTAGSTDGPDAIVVRDDATGDEAALSFEVRSGAKLEPFAARIALPPGSSVPLRVRGGTDTVTWEKTAGPGTLAGGRFVADATDRASSHLRGRDAFTADVVEVDIAVLDPVVAGGQLGDALGSSVALTTRAAGALASFGAPAFDGALGRVYIHDTSTSATAVALEGSATPLHRGRRVGAGVAFTDFNGDGRPDLVAGAPDFVLPTASNRSSEVTPYYASEHAGCVVATTVSKGAALVALGQVNGTFVPAYRLWRDVSGVGDLGYDVSGGFDFNGDGKQDVAARRSDGVDVYLGRALEDAGGAKLTMGCDAALAVPKLAARVVAVTPLGDVDGDGCAELALGYHDASHGGVVVAFGFDVGGARCGGRTAPSFVQMAADADVGETYLGLGISVANAGAFVGGAKRWLAVGASHLTFGSGARSGVMLLDLAAIAGLRPPSGTKLVGVVASGVANHVLTTSEALDGFGEALSGGVDVTRDGIVDLVVGAPRAPFAADGAGAAAVFAGGATSTGELSPYLIIAGDDGSVPASLGRSLSALPAQGARPALLAIGSPTSARLGAGNGAAYLLALP